MAVTMGDDVVLISQTAAASAALGTALRLGGLTVHAHTLDAPPDAAILVTALPDAEPAMAAARAFAAQPAHGQPRLIVLIRPAAPRTDWAACRDAATLTAFIRHAALSNAARDIRINGLERGSGVSEQDIADAILALWRWRSMTGQTIRLDGP
jgi:hypothetical protein